MSKNMQMSRWREGHRRKSPRICALDEGKRKLQHLEDRETSNHEDHSANIYQPPDLMAKQRPKHGDQATSTDQPSVTPSVSTMPEMPEKRILELILDVLQRRDTYEIFAEPVDPNEVEDYYEIVDEPMDFGTMRAKLHEGMYTSLEQFEHDVLLIPRNAMYFNSSATIYFRQGRAIQELAKKVFQVLRTDPDNFESEFSGTTRRSIRRPQSESKGLKSCSGLALSVVRSSGSIKADDSSKSTPCTSSGPSSFKKRSRENLGSPCSGARNGRRSSFIETDCRSTYRPLMSNHNQNNSAVSTTYNDPKPLTLVNQREISYTESLMLFVKDLGPTAQMVAKRKLQGCLENAPSNQTPSLNSCPVLRSPKCQIPFSAAFASTQTGPSTLDTITTTNTSPKFLDQLLGPWPVIGKTSEVIDLTTDVDDGKKTSNNEGSSNDYWKVFFGDSERNKLHRNQSPREFKSTFSGVKKTRNKDADKVNFQARPLVLALESSKSHVFDFKLKKERYLTSSSRPTLGSWVSTVSKTGSNMQSFGSVHCKERIKAAASEVQSNKVVPLESDFNFKSRLNQTNNLFFGQNGVFLQQPKLQRDFSGAGRRGLFDRFMSNYDKKSSLGCAQHAAESSSRPFLGYQQQRQQQSSLDTVIDTDLTLQL